MTYKEKLTLLFGGLPTEGSIEYNMKTLKFNSLEERAKDLFKGTTILPKYKARAKNQGLFLKSQFIYNIKLNRHKILCAVF